MATGAVALAVLWGCPLTQMVLMKDLCHGLGGRGEAWLCKVVLVSSLGFGGNGSVPLKTLDLP